MEVYSQDLYNDTFTQKGKFDRRKFKTETEYYDDYIQESIMDALNRYTVGLTSLDHISFLDYFNQTSKSTEYVKVE